MNMLNELLNRQEYWDIAYQRIVNKPYVTSEIMADSWFIKEVEKEEIIEQLISGTYQWSIPEKIEIAKSGTTRKRVVYMYDLKDRIVLGVLYRGLSVYLKDKMSKSCFSYKTGTNTGDAIGYIGNLGFNGKGHGLKVDIHAYFNSVSESRVVEMIEELFPSDVPELRGVRQTIYDVMLNKEVSWHGRNIQEFKSLVPGCALGSLFANYCLSDMDRYFEDKGIIYARYSDDIVLFEETREELDHDVEVILGYLKNYGLEINIAKYKYFNPGDNIDFLGLELDDKGIIDISKHAKQKIKKQIHRWCKKGREEIERDHKSFDSVAKRIIRRMNNKNYKCFIENSTKFGWGIYAFRYINTTKSLTEIDFYTKDTLRAMKTGKHNKANVKSISDEELRQLGLVSMFDMYTLYKRDFDYYCEIAELM